MQSFFKPCFRYFRKEARLSTDTIKNAAQREGLVGTCVLAVPLARVLFLAFHSHFIIIPTLATRQKYGALAYYLQ